MMVGKTFEQYCAWYGCTSVDRVESQGDKMVRIWCRPNVRYSRAAMPPSEVCIHMGIADKPMDFELIEREYVEDGATKLRYSCQLYKPDTNEMFSSSITTGEGGMYYSDGHGRRWTGYYFYPDFPPAEVPTEKRVNII